ncbi:response regulator [Ignatzschineria indica]|uniref:response regulator n=1 Tax=Ignatzschineria indica TaxID=472583 RepID=UPI00257528E0|nr:response regulator [Ignatzschineria indica]MDM1544673.1 response regulator [Ignatzschineria indica]
MKKILIVEDEIPISEMIEHFLSSQGFEVIQAFDGNEAKEILAQNPKIDLILLDWMMPQKSGIDLLKELKASRKNRHIPVIMLSARAELEDRVVGLDSGADDYLPKPFAMKELLSRINSLLRRIDEYVEEENEIREVAGIELDLDAQRITINGELINLSAIEFRLLAFFITHIDRVYSRDQLLDHVWGIDSYVDERTVDVTIGRLRKILEPTGHNKLLQTVRGEGYRFSPHA